MPLGLATRVCTLLLPFAAAMELPALEGSLMFLPSTLASQKAFTSTSIMP